MKWLLSGVYWLGALLFGLLCLQSPLWANGLGSDLAMINPGDVAPALRHASFLGGVMMLAHVYRHAWLGWRG